MNTRIKLFGLALVLCVAPSIARAQETQTEPWSLFSVRFDTHTSDFLYAVYGYGSNFGMTGVLYNPRSGFNELLAAGGRTFNIAGLSQFVAAGGAREDGLWYAQLYILPAAKVGHVWLRATSELDAPISSGATLQYSLSPISGTMDLGRFVQAGLGADVAMARESKTELDVGPEFRFALPKATFIVDGQSGLDAKRTRLRLSFTAAF